MKPQTSGLVVGKLKHKILWEPVGVALNGKIQRFGGNAVEIGQVCIEHDLLAADQKYSPLNLNCQGVGEFLFFCHFWRQTLTETFCDEKPPSHFFAMACQGGEAHEVRKIAESGRRLKEIKN